MLFQRSSMLVVILVSLWVRPLFGATNAIDVVGLPGEHLSMHCYMYVGDNVPEVRGVIFMLRNGNAIYIYGDPTWRAMCDELGFGLMFIQPYNVDTSAGDPAKRADLGGGRQVLTALTNFAGLFGHPEMAWATLLTWGHSAQGNFAVTFPMLYPERSIGFMVNCSSLIGGGTIDYNKIKAIPGIFVAGDADPTAGYTPQLNFFNNGRSAAYDAPWIFALATGADGASHNPPVTGNANEAKLYYSFVRQIVAARLPANVTNSAPNLRPLNNSNAYLGTLGANGITIAAAVASPYAQFSGDKTKASWLVDPTMANAWLAFHGASPVGVTPATPANLTASLVGSNQIGLAWTDTSTNEMQFRIERKVGFGSFAFLTNRPALSGTGGSGNFSDTNLNAGTTYTYRVRADGTNATSAWSSEVSTNTPGGGGGLMNWFEAELLSIAATSAGDPTENFAEPNASGGTNSLFTANAIGDFITYTVNVPLAGDYNVSVTLNQAANRGRCNLYVDGSLAAQGGEMDLYNASGYAYQELNLGNVTFTNAGAHTFKFQVSGKNASATAYKLAFDCLKLIGSNPAPLTPPAIAGTVFSNNNFVLSFSTESGGLYEVQRTEQLVPPAWTPVATNIPGTGGTIQITNAIELIQPRRFYRVKRGM